MIFFHTLKNSRSSVLSRYWIWFPMSVLSVFGLLWSGGDFGQSLVMAQVPGGEPDSGRAVVARADSSDDAQVSEGVSNAEPNGPPTPPRMFQIDVKVVNSDGTSLRNLPVLGWYEVKPKGELELPEVLLSSPPNASELQGGLGTLPGQAAIHGGALMGQASVGGSGGVVFGGSDSTIGGAMMTDQNIGAIGFSGNFPLIPGNQQGTALSLDRLDPAIRREVERRVTWQVQADWVRDSIRSHSKQDKEIQKREREQLKELLRMVLRDQYADQLRRQELEFEVVERRVEKLRKQIADRSVAAERAIEFELERIDLTNDGLLLEKEATFLGK
jgi:hypothetical protein